MKKDRRHTAINDAGLSLHLLAKLMPALASPGTLGEVLARINATLGARLSWVLLENEDVSHLEVFGDLECHMSQVRGLLRQPKLNQHGASWRVKYWRKDVGKLLYTDCHPLADELISGVMCKISLHPGQDNGYFFIAFPQPVMSPAIVKNMAIIIVEKLHDFLTELIMRERTARELQNIVNQYRILFDRAPVLMNSFDNNNRCVLWNGECERLFGWTLEEINQQPDPLALFYPDPDIRRQVRAAVNTSPTLEMHEWYPRRRDGSVLTTLWSNILLPDGDILNIGVDITERKKTEKLLELKATTDALTSCFNRFAILEHLQSALDHCHADQAHTHFSLLMLDLDHFKQINDNWGHLTGDAALIYFCQRVREQSDNSVMLGRLGGEEFLILLPQKDSDQAMAFTESLRDKLLNKPFLIDNEYITLSFSAGLVTVHRAGHESSVLLTLVDKALYDAKRTGRGKTVVTATPRQG